MKTITKTKYFISWIIIWLSLISIWTYATYTQPGMIGSLFKKVWSSYKLIWKNITETIESDVNTDQNILKWDTAWYLKRITDQWWVQLSADSSVVIHAWDHHESYEDDLWIKNDTISENIWLTSDWEINFITNYQNGIDDSQKIKFTKAWNIEPNWGNWLDWPNDVWGWSWDDAWIKYIQDGSWEDTELQIWIANDWADNIAFYQDWEERMTIVNWKVGIWITSPSHKLHVNWTIRWSDSYLTTDKWGSIELGSSWTPYIDLKNDSWDDYDWRIILTWDDELRIDWANLKVDKVKTTCIWNCY